MNLEQCWVSPVAIAMITDLSLSPENPVHAYHVFPAQGELLYRAFSVVILQLLRQKRQVLRNRSQCDELRTELYELQKYEGKDQKHMETDDDRLCALRKVALRVMSFFEESETVYIILDRADRCCNWKKGIDHRKPLLKALVKMVEAARCKLKVLVVIDRYQWDIEERRNELGEKTKEKVIVHTVEQEYSA